MSYIMLKNDVKSAFTNVINAYQDITTSKTFINNNGSQRFIQTFVNLTFPTWIETSIHRHVVEFAIKAEQMAPDGLRAFLESLHEGYNNNYLPPEGDTRLNVVARKQDIISYIQDTVSVAQKTLGEMIIDAVFLAGLNGKITVEKTFSNIEHVEHVPGYVFPVKTAIASEHVRHVSPLVYCADALIEEVSHVEELLEKLQECKTTCFLFARGFSDNVLQTIQSNRIPLIPVNVPVDYETINALVDIAIVSGLPDVLSHLKGDQIESIDISSMKQVDRIDVHTDHINILNRGTRFNVSKHVNKLAKERQFQEHDMVIDYMTLRIKTLTPNSVFIRLRDNSTFIERSQIIDDCLRGIKSMITHGVDNKKPALTRDVASIFASRCLASINDIDCALKV